MINLTPGNYLNQSVHYLSFDFLEEIKPFENDRIFTENEMDVEDEIKKLSEEINALDIDTIPFDKWDYIVIFSTAMLEITQDFLISDHHNKHSISHKDSDFSKWLNSIHDGKDPVTGKRLEKDKLNRKIHDFLTKNHKGSPLDYQGYKFGGGSHRGRTFSHDILFILLAIYSISTGKFIDGYYEDCKFIKVISEVNQNGNPYQSMGMGEATLEYLLHMIADFFSAKSLPIPGFSILTHFPNRDIRKFANELYQDGLNMRNLAMQGVPVATAEIILWIYTSLRYKDSSYSKEMVKHKKEQMLLMTHGIATAVNIGKVIITKRPTSLNLVMIIRTVHLVYKVLKKELELNARAHKILTLTTLKSQFETMETLLLLEKSMYYTKEISRVIEGNKQAFNNSNRERVSNLEVGFDQISDMMNELKKLNNEGKVQ